MQIPKMWKYIKTTTNWEARKDPVSVCKADTGRDQEEPSCMVQLFCFRPMCGFLPETFETQNTGLEIAALVTEVGCEASQLIFNHTALARHTAPLMGRREGEERGGHHS